MIRLLRRLIRTLRRTRPFECFHCGRKRRIYKSIMNYTCVCRCEFRLVKFTDKLVILTRGDQL